LRNPALDHAIYLEYAFVEDHSSMGFSEGRVQELALLAPKGTIRAEDVRPKAARKSAISIIFRFKKLSYMFITLYRSKGFKKSFLRCPIWIIISGEQV